MSRAGSSPLVAQPCPPRNQTPGGRRSHTTPMNLSGGSRVLALIMLVALSAAPAAAFTAGGPALMIQRPAGPSPQGMALSRPRARISAPARRAYCPGRIGGFQEAKGAETPAVCAAYSGAGGGAGGGVWATRHGVAGGDEDGERGLGRELGMRLLEAGIIVQVPDLVARGVRRRRSSGMAGGLCQMLLVVNVLVFLAQMMTEGAVLGAGAMIATNIMQGGELWRLVTPMFLHGSLQHLLVNSLSLNAVGPQVESLFGMDRFSIVYFAAGIAGNAASCFLGPRVGMSVGASGAIFGLVGAMGVFLSRHQELFVNSQGALRAIAQTIVLNLAMGMMPGSRIDNWGHLGGVVGGAAVALLIGPNLQAKNTPYGPVLVDNPLIALPWRQKKPSPSRLAGGY